MTYYRDELDHIGRLKRHRIDWKLTMQLLGAVIVGFLAGFGAIAVVFFITGATL